MLIEPLADGARERLNGLCLNDTSRHKSLASTSMNLLSFRIGGWLNGGRNIVTVVAALE